MSIKKKEDHFFTLLKEDVALIQKITGMYYDLVHDFTDVEEKADQINKMESECDSKTHAIIAELNKAFITPFDREDIFVLVKTMDNIADTIEVTATCFVLYDTDSLRKGVIEMAENIKGAVDTMVKLFDSLPYFKKGADTIKLCIDIHHYESMNDDIFRDCIYHLFRENIDTLEIMKWNRLYKMMEDIIDVCDDVSQLVEGIVMKNA